MKYTTLILALAFSIITSFSASAWGRFGHCTIAEIAERNLTPQAKANIEKYTKGTPLHEYAVWMDVVRKTDPHHAAATDGWHASIVNEQCKTSQEIRNKHRNGRDTVTGLLGLEELLKDREKLTDSVVMFALKSIVHMVGDMHCPAHVRFTDNENGCKFPVKYFGRDRNYHSVWDTRVLTHEYKGWSHLEYATKLNTLKKGEIKRVTKGWFEDWLEEAGRDVRPTLTWVKPGDELDDEFQNKAFPLAEVQVRKAGYRLAALLNEIFN